MLYLFGRLALHDSYYFNQDFQTDDYQEDLGRDRCLAEPAAAARAAAVSRRLRRGRHGLLAGRASASPRG